jgi:HlyD family secretion protein
MRRFFIWLLILAVLGGLLVGGGLAGAAWWKQQFKPKFQTAEVSRGRVETVVNSTGTVKPVRTVSVGAFTSGPIKKINVDFNDVVKKDEELALNDQKVQQATLNGANAGLQRDEAALETQEADLERVTALCKQAKENKERAEKLRAINKDYLSDTDWDQYQYTAITCAVQVKLSKANVAQAKATVALSKANVENAEANLDYTHIRSPEAGVVIERKVEPGQTVASNYQTPELFIVAPDLSTMFVYASVDEADIGLIQAAEEHRRPVKFTVDSHPGELFEGEIHQIRNNSTTTQNVVTYPVVIKAANPGLKLKPGMTANLSFQTEARDDVLRVPVAALRFSPLAYQVRPEDAHYVTPPPTDGPQAKTTATAAEKAEQSKSRRRRVVWVKDGDLLRAVPVMLGLIENQWAEVVEGELSAGDKLVTGLENLFGPR